MPMRDDFCIFILTNGRPDRVYTYNCLERAGYTGKVFIVIDDEDKTADAYRARFGEEWVFSNVKPGLITEAKLKIFSLNLCTQLK